MLLLKCFAVQNNTLTHMFEYTIMDLYVVYNYYI